ncbi:MAG TPA: hypothetical protein VLZ83_13025 [Edaphocola sp.]|nr:hypothetical protein [Edaphocola sp.]
MSNESVEQVHFDNLVVGQESGSLLEERHLPNWKDWGKRMHKRFGRSLGFDFEGYGADGYGSELSSVFSPYIAIEAEVTAGLYLSNNKFSVGFMNNVYYDIVISINGNSYNKGTTSDVGKTKWIDIEYSPNLTIGAQY